MSRGRGGSAAGFLGMKKSHQTDGEAREPSAKWAGGPTAEIKAGPPPGALPASGRVRWKPSPGDSEQNGPGEEHQKLFLNKAWAGKAGWPHGGAPVCSGSASPGLNQICSRFLWRESRELSNSRCLALVVSPDVNSYLVCFGSRLVAKNEADKR